MKRLVLVSLAGAGTLAALAVGIAVLRPELVPAWARVAPAQAGDAGPDCEEHGVPERFCTLCHPDLRGKLLLCPEHGNLPEDICTLCHPEVRKKYHIRMCPKGHGLPAYFCTRCGKGTTAAADNLIDDGYCASIGDPAGPDGKPRFCKLLPLVRLASADLGRDIGLRTAPVAAVEHVHELAANAETAYDANRYAEITPRVVGFLRAARADLGRKVRAGEALALVDSAEVSTAKTQYLTAHAAVQLDEDAYRRAKQLTDAQILGGKQEFMTRIAMIQARTSLLNAEQKLRNLRFDDTALALTLKSNDTRPLLDITTPIDGTVVFRHAVLGESVEPATKLYTVADTSTMWLWIDVFEKDIARVRAGQAVRFIVSGSNSADEEVASSGRITWVGTEVDRKTRTTRVRAEVPNPDGRLRANQFGRATIQVRERHRALLVAKSAVQRYENAEMVFIPEKEGTYRPQRIKTRPLGRGDVLEVAWGLTPGEEVVTTGSFLLKTEIMKGSIGAGCCD